MRIAVFRRFYGFKEPKWLKIFVQQQLDCKLGEIEFINLNEKFNPYEVIKEYDIIIGEVPIEFIAELLPIQKYYNYGHSDQGSVITLPDGERVNIGIDRLIQYKVEVVI